MDNFNLDELMDLAEAYVGPMVDAIYRRLIERDFALEDPEVVMLLTALINILGHDNRGDRPTEVLLMAAYGERGVLDRPNMRVMRWRNGALSGSDLANEPGLGSSRTYQPGEMPMPSKPKPGLTRMHREVNSEATSSGSPLRAAVPPKRAKVTQKVQTNQTIQDLDEMNDQLRSTKKELDDMTKTILAMEEDRDMWRKLFEDCNKKQGQEIERLRQEYKERSEQVALTTAIEKVIPARDIPRGQSPMELLTPREMSQTTKTRLPAETNRVTIPNPSDTLGDPVVEQTVRKLIETAGRLVANKNAPGSGVTAPYGTIDDTGRVQLSQTVIRQGMSNVTPLMGNSRIPERKVRKMPAKEVSRVIDVQKNNQLKYNFTGVPETNPRACFNRATWSPAVNLQQPPLGTSHLILGDSLVRVLSNLRTSWVTTVMAFGGATIAQLYRMVELMNPGKIPNVMILVGTNDISRGSDEQEALWESMMVCLFTTLWQKFSCAVLTICTVPMNARSLTASGRRHNEGVMRWNNILRNLANRNARRMILMDIEHELRAMDQARLTTDGIHFDSVEGQAWLSRVFQERLDELEAELFDTGVLKEEGTVSDTVITTFVPPNLETRLGTVPAVTNYRQQSSSEPGQRTDVNFRDRMAEVERGHIEVFPKLWNLRPYDRTNGEMNRVPRLTAAYHKVREETKDWGDYKKLPEAIPEFPLIRRMLLGAVSVVQTPRLRAFETNERRVGNFVGTMDPYFVGRNAAVLQYTRFAYTDQATRRRISNVATPKPGAFDAEWAELNLTPMRMRGRIELPEASLILKSVK